IVISAIYAVAAGPLGPGLPDNPFGVVDVPAAARDALSNVGSAFLVGAMVIAVGALAVRGRRGDRRERSQLKWFFAALVIAGVLFPVTFGGSDDEAPTVLTLLAVGSVSLIPVAVGVAVL